MTRQHSMLSGFTLVEMAIVLIIVTVLMGGLAVGLTSQYDARAQSLTEQTLIDVRDALLGYAVNQHQFPCPADPTATTNTGFESRPCTTGTPGVTWGGLVPGKTLGLSPINEKGYVLDGWGQPIHYALTPAFAIAAQVTLTTPGTLIVCSLGSSVSNEGASNADCNPTSNRLTNNAVAVIFSTGKNWSTGGSSANERQNSHPTGTTQPDPVFFSGNAQVSAAGGEFDDIVTWISPYTLYSRMITAGQLP